MQKGSSEQKGKRDKAAPGDETGVMWIILGPYSVLNAGSSGILPILWKCPSSNGILQPGRELGVGYSIVCPERSSAHPGRGKRCQTRYGMPEALFEQVPAACFCHLPGIGIFQDHPRSLRPATCCSGRCRYGRVFNGPPPDQTPKEESPPTER